MNGLMVTKSSICIEQVEMERAPSWYFGHFPKLIVETHKHQQLKTHFVIRLLTFSYQQIALTTRDQPIPCTSLDGPRCNSKV